MSSSASPARILVATKDEFWPSIRTSLIGYELVFAPHVTDAKKFLTKEHFDLFLIGIFFDDSKGVELLNNIRLTPLDVTTPIVAARLKDTNNNDMLDQILDALVQAKIANEYISGDSTTKDVQKQLRTMVEKYLPPATIVPLL